MSSPRCSEVSLEAGESLAATATAAEHWLLIEVRGSWPRDVSVDRARALEGRIDPERYRGRTCYAKNVQAAEREVREARDLTVAADLQLAGVDGSVV